MKYCEIIIDVANENVDKLYTYKTAGHSIVPGMRVVVPFGARRVEGYVIRVFDKGNYPEEKLRDILSVIDTWPVILPNMMQLAMWMTEKYHCFLVDALRLMIPAQMRGGRVRERTEKMASLTVYGEEFEKALEKQSAAPKRKRILRLLQNGPMHTAMINAAEPNSYSALKKLAQQGYVELDVRESLRQPYGSVVYEGEKHTPNRYQSAAISALISAIDQGGGSFLLHGVAGSGKTEVYMHAIEHALASGKSAIMLVPEIALAPQMVDWFRARFGDISAVLHSRLSPGERYDEWRRIRRGEAQVVIGARSAVFAPIRNLGIIVIDEEHEESYISEKTPKYITHEVAARRCEQEGAVLALGSATPSIETFSRAMQREYELLELPDRVNQKPPPKATIVDMREELLKGNKSIFSAQLMRELGDCLSRGDQAILLLNRRGYSTFVSCRACGYVCKCGDCDINMTYHMSANNMQCHYCGNTRPPPPVCPNCGSRFIKYFGMGTQKAEDELKKLFPGVKYLRMDMDTTRAKNSHYDLITRFRNREAQILLGTKMIAKGLDFPDVTLVGVLAADAMLHLPDYRSAERTFQLITQVAGRAGRAQKDGRVVVQAYDVSHYAIDCALRYDYRDFFHTEITLRRRKHLPPFTHETRFLAESDDAQAASAAAQAIEKDMLKWLDENAEDAKQVLKLHLNQAPIHKLRGLYRYQVFVRIYSVNSENILGYMRRLSRVTRENANVTLEVNPLSML